MSGDILGTHFGGGVDSNQVKSGFSQTILVFSSQFFWVFQFILGFLVFWVNLDETWNLQPLVSTSHSGLLIWTRGVLQGISGGALWVVR